ncbi:MAG: type II secretion system protein, partial [Pirellula sp.]
MSYSCLSTSNLVGGRSHLKVRRGFTLVELLVV